MNLSLDSPYWFEVAVICAITTAGNIVMGHWEEQLPKWRRLSKVALLCLFSVWLSTTFGRPWFFAMLGLVSVVVTVIHAWWLPRQGINGWTAEPREKYYALRGWKWPPDRR
jgi:hypothetical protein